MNIFSKSNLIKSSLALACSTSIAQAATEEVIVTAKGGQTIDNILQTAHIFDLNDIEAAQAKDIPALLKQITGISVTDSGGRGSATNVFLRGISSSQTIVLIDGVRVGSATLGAAALNSYPVEAIERIEVIKGPFSGIYGADAVGGVIQLFTKKSGDGVGSVSATVGSDSLAEYSASLNGGNEKHSFFISVHHEDTDGIDRTSITTGGNEDTDGFEETAISLAGKVTLSDSTTAQLSILATDSTVDFDNTFGSDPGSQTDSETFSAALNISSELSEQLTWVTTFGSNEDEAITTASFNSEFTTNRDSIGTELAYLINDSNTLTVGIDYYEEDIESSSDFPVTERDNTGVYAQLSSRFDNVDVVGSLRYDDNSAYGTETNGSIAFGYTFSEQLRVTASYGTAFVAPSFNFLYFPFFGNPDILPEESESVELSLIGNTEVLNWRISAYQNDIDNLFSFDPDTFLAANVGEAELKGVEIEIGTLLADWNIAANVDFLSAEDKDTGLELDDRAENSLSLSASRNYGKLDLRFDLTAESDRFDNRGTELSSYALFDISAQYQFNDRLSLSANVDNLFDKDYTVNLIGASNRFNTEGRQIKATIRYAF